MPTLFLVGTPIGNLEDITLRALRILREVSVIAAEDTRTTGRLLQHFDIDTPLISFHDFSDEARIGELLQKLVAADVALVSEAGMPGLSDPGFRLVRAALEAGMTVTPVPGPTAVVTALVSSGLSTDRFLFLGFLPRQSGARQESLAMVATLPYTLVIYEAPHRLLDLLADIEMVLGNRPLAAARELTKMYEEIWRGTVSEAAQHFSRAKIRGEFTVVVAGASDVVEKWDEGAVREAMAAHLAKGLRRKRAAAIVAARSGWRKKEVYDLSLQENL